MSDHYLQKVYTVFSLSDFLIQPFTLPYSDPFLMYSPTVKKGENQGREWETPAYAPSGSTLRSPVCLESNSDKG